MDLSNREGISCAGLCVPTICLDLNHERISGEAISCGNPDIDFSTSDDHVFGSNVIYFCIVLTSL